MKLDVLLFTIITICVFVYVLRQQERFSLADAKNKVCIGPYISTDLLSVPNQCGGCVAYNATPEEYANCIKSNVRAMVKSDNIDLNAPENQYAKKQVRFACSNPYNPEGMMNTDICKTVM
jgi:hypothetical protein